MSSTCTWPSIRQPELPALAIGLEGLVMSPHGALTYAPRERKVWCQEMRSTCFDRGFLADRMRVMKWDRVNTFKTCI